MAEVDLIIDVETKRSINELRNFGKEGTKALKNVEQQTKIASQAFASFAGNLAAIGLSKAFSGVISGFRSLANQFTQGIAAAQKQEDAINQLNTSLALAGSFTNEASKDFQDFARSLQQTSTSGDEAILGQLALARNFARSNEEAKKLVAVALDLSAATGISLDSAVRNVGKTFSGLQGELGELVPQVRALTAEQLQAGEALDVLGKRFGGAAQAQIKTFSGALAQTENTFGDLQEELGATFTQSQGVIDIVGELNGVFLKLQSFIKNNREEIRQFAADGIAFAINSVANLVDGVAFLTDAFNGFKLVLPTIAIALGDVFIKAREAFIAFVDSLNVGGVFDNFIAEQRKALAEQQTFAQAQKQVFDELGLRSVESGNNLRQAADGIRQFSKVVQDSAIKNAEVEIASQQSVEANRLAIEEQKKLQAEEEAVKAQEKALAAEQKRIADNEKEIADLQERADLLATIDADANAQEIARLKTLIDEKKKLRAEDSIATLRDKAKEIQAQRQLEADRVKAREESGAKIATLQNSNNRTLATAGKAAAITQIAIDTPAGVSKALAAFPPPFNFVAAALVGAAFAAQAAQVAGVKLATGLTEVPSGFPNDTFAANLTSGERVVSAPQNQDLKEFIANNGQTNQLLSAVVNRLDNLEMQTVVNIGNREIVNEINTATREGRVLEA